MKKTFKVCLFAVLLLVCFISVVACKNSSNTTISPTEAITRAVKDYPEFPANPKKIITKNLPTGGPIGSTTKVKFTTKVGKAEKDTYLVTFTKDWGITVNGTYVESYWKYRVNQDSLKLIESVDNENLPSIMK